MVGENASIFERKEVKAMDDTQPSLPDAWMRAVWQKLKDIQELLSIQAQEIKILRLRIERLETKVEQLADTEEFN
jgi:hypothetical protein